MAEYMKTGDAPLVSPLKEDLALVTQNGKTRNVKLKDVEGLFLGTENLGNTKSIKQNIIDNTTQLKEKVNKTSIINNCNTTEEGFVLDARQGKTLYDMLNRINIKKIYPNFINGVTNYTVNGITSDSKVIICNNHNNQYPVSSVVPSDNNLKIIMNSTDVNGQLAMTLLYVL